jgi:hypothetical protein
MHISQILGVTVKLNRQNPLPHASQDGNAAV